MLLLFYNAYVYGPTRFDCQASFRLVRSSIVLSLCSESSIRMGVQKQ